MCYKLIIRKYIIFLRNSGINSPSRQQWCNWAFPPGKYNTIPKSPDLSQYTKYGGFNIQADRLALIDGSKHFRTPPIPFQKLSPNTGVDPWLDLCYHAEGTPLRVSSDLHPEYLIAGAGHHWDSYGILDIAAEPLFIQQAHLWEIKTVQKWLRTFKSWKPARRS